MTVIDLHGLETSLGGTAPIAEGRVTARYWAGDRPYVNIAGADVTFPAPIQVRIVDGEPVAPLDVPPTLGVCCVRWTIEAVGVAQSVDRYTTVPPGAPVAFGALVDVDPATFTPSVEAVAGWASIVDEVHAAAATASAASDDAVKAVAPETLRATVTGITHDLYYDRF